MWSLCWQLPVVPPTQTPRKVMPLPDILSALWEVLGALLLPTNCPWEAWVPEAPGVGDEHLPMGVMVSCPECCWKRSSTFYDITVVATARKFGAQNSVFNATRERLTRKLLRILKMEGASHAFRRLQI